MQKFSYHTHTTFSDGKNSLEEMLTQATNLGWKEIGISDHLIYHKNIFSCFSGHHFQKNANKVYFSETNKAYEYMSQNIEYIRKVAKNYPLKVFVGFEVDYFPYDGWQEEMEKLLSKLTHDYLISGNHFILDNKGLDVIHPDVLPSYTHNQDAQKQLLSNHFKTIEKAVKSKMFSFLAHPDYMRNIPQCSEYDYMTEREYVIKALAENNMAFELSTKGFRKPHIQDYFPARWMLEKSQSLNIPIVVSDDAHCANELGSEFDSAENYLSELNYTNRWKLNI